MALNSMTGFARVTGASEQASWAWELKSVNGRGLDIRARTPAGFESLGEEARQLIGRRLTRGTVNVLLTLSQDQTVGAPRVNLDALRQLVAQLTQIDLPAGIEPARLDGLLAVRGIVETGAEELAVDALKPALLRDLSKAIEALARARAAEGEQITEVLTGQIETIAALVEAIESHPSRTADAIRARIAGQVAALLAGAQALDPARLHQEAALIAVRADVQEEIDRLKAHIASAREMLAGEGPVGRKLDFLAQEFGREASTTCAKATDVALSAIGVQLRTVVDQFREQVQNVE
jgi:uncharacterized protein (TIGR00255 family)